MKEKTPEEIIDEIMSSLITDVTYEKTYPAHTSYYQLDYNAFKQKFREMMYKVREEVIDYISLKQGWEETEDIYRKHFGLKEIYKNKLKK